MLSILKSRKTAPRLRRPEKINIKPYKLGMAYDNVPSTLIFADNPLLSAMFNTLSVQFPAGERFMIDAVRQFQQDITDEALKQDARGFIGQEAHHANEHEVMADALTKVNFPTELIVKQTEWMLDKITRLLPPKDLMATTAALEHFTAMLGSLVMNEPQLIQDVHPSIKPLFIWHAIEESEHKAVAFDVYQNTVGSYPRLMFAYLWSTSLLTALTAYYMALVMVKDRSIFNLRDNLKGLNWMFGFGNNAGHLRRRLPEFFTFFRPNFHPWEADNSDAITYWKNELNTLLKSDTNATNLNRT